jgi:hypothetical protein
MMVKRVPPQSFPSSRWMRLKRSPPSPPILDKLAHKIDQLRASGEIMHACYRSISPERTAECGNAVDHQNGGF